MHTALMGSSMGDRTQTGSPYRRYVVGSAIATGVVVGIGLGSFIALSGEWWCIVLLAFPIGIRVVGAATGRLILHDRVAWAWPFTTLAVAVSTSVLFCHPLSRRSRSVSRSHSGSP